ncbi:helix-turn-helix domain-containing protein [Furfurilactobacillus cerevisiae]|uniref:helix-turn-helix domain-containing protein n=1 Tax=Furfurilactobacillus rossiae TaxID=231049 RepID=UPI003B984C78
MQMIGEIIKETRHSKKLSLQQLSDNMKERYSSKAALPSRSMIQRYETNQTDIPAKTLLLIADYFELDLNSIAKVYGEANRR